MSYTLTFDERQKTIANPKEADIRAALKAHKDDIGPVFQIYPDGSNDALTVETSGDSSYTFSYADGSKTSYISKKDYLIEEAVKILTAYCTGSPDWKKMVDWKELKQ